MSLFAIADTHLSFSCDKPMDIFRGWDNHTERLFAVDVFAGIEGIEVCVAKTKYPQGGEKMLIKRVLGRQVPSGGLPADVGAVVCNVSTAKAISDAIQTGMPLIERVTTVTGKYIPNPGR